MIRIVSLTALLLVALLAAQFAHAQQQWIDYRPAGAGYRVEFPAKPVEDVRDVTTDVGTIKMRTSSVDIGGKVFMTIDSLYPSNVTMGDPQVNLDGARNSGVRNVEGTLRAEERLSVANAPARRMVIDMPRTNQSADALLVLDGRRMYQAVYVGPRGTEQAPEVRRFLSSFALVR
jgi:hypothetical protein